MLEAIFYARFHPERGPSIIHKYPNEFIIASQSADVEAKPHIPWNEISSYIIPPYEICNRPLSVRNNGYTILGYPVSIEADRYPRSRYTFNVCFVISEEENSTPWQPLVRKTADFFTGLEEEDGLLRKEEHLSGLKWAGEVDYPVIGLGVIYNILEGILEEINGYGETCVRHDDVHILNLRLPPTPKLLPPKVKAWDVPLFIRSLPKAEEWTWDLTLGRIHEYVNGINHVQRISELADVELKLVKKAVRELVYHDRAVVLDIFHFQAMYMLTDVFVYFAKDEHMQDECRRYVAIEPATNLFIDPAHKPPPTAASAPRALPTKETLLLLYRAIHPGLTVHAFVLANQHSLSTIDIRRFITFGLLKGFLRRVHKFALTVHTSTTASVQPSGPSSFTNGAHAAAMRPSVGAREEFDRAWKKAALSSGWETPPTELPLVGAAPTSGASARNSGAVAVDGSSDETHAGDEAELEKLRKYLDGKHCLDQVCVEMHLSEKKVVEKVTSGRFGEVVFFSR